MNDVMMSVVMLTFVIPNVAMLCFFMLNCNYADFIMLFRHAEYCYTERCIADCCYTECHYTKFLQAEC